MFVGSTINFMDLSSLGRKTVSRERGRGAAGKDRIELRQFPGPAISFSEKVRDDVKKDQRLNHY